MVSHGKETMNNISMICYKC